MSSGVHIDERRVNPDGLVRYISVYDDRLEYKPQFEIGIPAVGDKIVLGDDTWLVVDRFWNWLVHPHSDSGRAGMRGGLTLIVERSESPYADECAIEEWPQPEDDD